MGKRIAYINIMMWFLTLLFSCSQPKSNETTGSSNQKPKEYSPFNSDYLNNPIFVHERALIKLENCDLDGAMAELTFDIEHNDLNDLSYYGRGKIKLIKKRNWSALYDFTRAVMKNPKNGLYFTARAEAKINLGLIKWSISDLRNAIQLGDTSSIAFFRKYCKPDS